MASPLAAFVVGNGVYAHAEGLAAAQDANTLTALLRDRAPGAPVACVTNADNAGLGAGFRSYLGSLSDGCVALVYFGGYGWRVEGKHYLLGVDTPLPTQANVAGVCVSGAARVCLGNVGLWLSVLHVSGLVCGVGVGAVVMWLRLAGAWLLLLLLVLQWGM